MPFPRQSIHFIGNLGKDPDNRFTPAGKPVSNFSLAVSRKYTNGSGEEVKETIWIACAAWGKVAEAIHASDLHKGEQVLVFGNLKPTPTGQPRTFTLQDGSAGASFDFTVSELWRSIMGRAASHDGAAVGAYDPDQPPPDDIPF